MSYTKLANSILTSTVWMEDDHTRIVWFALLAMADRNGEVQASIPGLANIARVPIESCRAAIARFLSPDPDSRSKIDDGRRLSEIKGGWFLVNHPEYRELASDEDRKLKAAIRQQRFRDSNARNKTVTLPSRQIPQADADADSKEEKTSSKDDHAIGKYHENSITILECLNRLTGLHFRPVDSHLKLISARLREVGVETTGVEQMLVRMVSKWRGTEMEQYLRPSTLFGKQKFDEYYASRNEPSNPMIKVKPSIPAAQPRCGVGHNFV